MIPLAWINFVLCIIGVVVNVLYVLKCKDKELYRWIKLLNAVSCLMVGVNYYGILFNGGAGAVQIRFATTMILISIAAGGIVSMARLPVTQWELKLWCSFKPFNSLLRRGNEKWR